MKVYAMLADGFEEVEALAVIDILRRAKVDVDTVSVSGKNLVAGAHSIGIMADILFEEADFDSCDLIFLPGGMPGTKNLDVHPGLRDRILTFAKQGKKLAAICAAPSVLGHLGVLRGKKAICYPGFEEELTGAIITDERVVVDESVITSKGMGTAIELGLELVKILVGESEAETIKEGIQY
jgi:4-methyl-5(b-hydroxyethyl)-thiazole monophosphate biosynthesis